MTEQEKALVDRSRLFVLGVPKKKFYRQVFEVEVLSESEPLNNVSLQDIAYEITVVGQFEIENT
jgi:D-Tyr-tRNAtyr deacylase